MKKSFLFMMLASMNVSAQMPGNFLLGQYDETLDARFVNLSQTSLPTNKPNMWLQKEVTDKLLRAYLDFKRDHPDIPFVIVSATRNYQYQNGIWARKWQATYPKFNDHQQTAKDILRFSSMPGTSRHHWGTDIDITNLNSSYFLNDPKGKILYAWLQENMPKYGFCQPYTKGRKQGYQTEEWHWSYQPLSSKYIAQYRQLMADSPETVTQQLTFLGHTNLPLEPLIEQYVFSVDKRCL